MSFDEQPDGDIHGECAAEIHRLEKEIKTERARAVISEAKWQQACHDKEALQDQLDACRPFLGEGETAADALIRIQKEVTALRNAAMQQWADRSVCDKEDAARYRWARMSRLWLMANIPAMLHAGEFDAEIDKARAAQEVAE